MAAIIPILTALVGGAAAVSTYQAGKEAKKESKRQQALIAKQEAKIEEDKKRQERVTQERRQRLSTRELLTGGETGLTGQTQATLLGGS